MAASRTRRPAWRPRAGATAAAALVLALVLIAGASAPGAAYDISVNPYLDARRDNCGPHGTLADLWCGTWETDPPTLSSAPQAAFRPLGVVRLERITDEASELLKGKPFGDVTIAPACGRPALHYVGLYEGGQIVACTAGQDEVLEGVYREDAGQLRSGSFRIHLPGIAPSFAGSLHQTAAGAPDNQWSGRCAGGWCLNVRTTKPKCAGEVATIIAAPPEDNGLGVQVPTFGTPGPDVIVGTSSPDTILAGGGDDIVCGREGDDHIVGGGGTDNLYGQAGADVLRTSSRRVDEDEFLDGGSGDDNLRGGSGKDSIDPGLGDDDVDGRGDPNDTVVYTTAPARVRVDLRRGIGKGKGVGGIDHIAGVEIVVGSRFDDILTGSRGDDTLLGERGLDEIRGLAGDDSLFGGEGPDDLDGGMGSDQTTGGPGTDRCRDGEVSQSCELRLPALRR